MSSANNNETRPRQEVVKVRRSWWWLLDERMNGSWSGFGRCVENSMRRILVKNLGYPGGTDVTHSNEFGTWAIVESTSRRHDSSTKSHPLDSAFMKISFYCPFVYHRYNQPPFCQNSRCLLPIWCSDGIKLNRPEPVRREKGTIKNTSVHRSIHAFAFAHHPIPFHS